MVSGDEWIFGGGFGVVAYSEFLVVGCDLMRSGFGSQLESLVVVAYHVTSFNLYQTSI